MVTASIIVGWVLSAYQIAGTIKASIQNSRIAKLANDIAKAINKNATLRANLMEAYSEGNTKKLNALMMQSPLGSAYKHLVGEIKSDREKYENAKKLLDQSTEDLQSDYNDVTAASRSGDLYADLKKDKDEGDVAQLEEKVKQTLTVADELVNGGIKNG